MAVAATIGCGGDGSATDGNQPYDVDANTTMTAGGISKAQFVARVNRICRKSWVKVIDNFTKFNDRREPGMSKAERFEEAIRFSLLAGIDFYIFDYIRRLGAPAGDERTIEEIIGPFQAAVELGAKRRTYSVAQLSGQFNQFNQRALSYGLEDCLVNDEHLGPIES
jgi:hypothetical protein